MNNQLIIHSLLSFLSLLIIAQISYNLNLVDLPSKRKMHIKATTYTGGIAISIILVLSILLFDISDSSFNNILSIKYVILKK